MSGSRTWSWIDLPSFGSTALKMFTLPVFSSVGPPEALPELELLLVEQAAAIKSATASGINVFGRRMWAPSFRSRCISCTHSLYGQTAPVRSGVVGPDG